MHCFGGFRSCFLVICIDGTFLKSKYGGHLLFTVAFDANNHLFLIAFTIVDNGIIVGEKMYLTAYAYGQCEFPNHFAKLKAKDTKET